MMRENGKKGVFARCFFKNGLDSAAFCKILLVFLPVP